MNRNIRCSHKGYGNKTVEIVTWRNNMILYIIGTIGELVDNKVIPQKEILLSDIDRWAVIPYSDYREKKVRDFPVVDSRDECLRIIDKNVKISMKGR